MNQQFGFEIYGAGACVSADSASLLEQVKARLPPVWMPRTPQAGDAQFEIRDTGPDQYQLTSGSFPPAEGTLEFTLKLLDVQLRSHISQNTPTKVFVHAGVVGLHGAGIVIPGVSCSGKTELVVELIRCGATYLSDECAVLDALGAVHPFVKPLSIRIDARTQRDREVVSLGGRAATGPLPIRLIVLSQFRAGASWQPRRLSPADAVLALLPHAANIHTRPAETMTALKQAVAVSIVLEGTRGEASEVVPHLIEALDSAQELAPRVS